MSTPMIGRAVVIGGSIGGLTAASALAQRAKEVVLVERRRLPDEGTTASIAPQGGFPHALLVSGAAALERLAPGLMAELFAHGAVGEASGERERRCHWWAAGRVRASLPDLGMSVPLCSRALVETRLRAHVLARTNVRSEEGLAVRGVRVRHGRIDGVLAERDGENVSLDAELVVDASGRASRAASWLREAGVREPPTSRVEAQIAYTTVDVRRLSNDLDGALFAVVQNTPELARIGVALPAEGGRWKVLLGGYFGDAAPATRDGMLAFAASLPDPVIADLLANEWLGEPMRYRFPFSQRRHWEAVREIPCGFGVVGDAVASFNPLYGQGMSAAALQAEALGACLDRFGNGAAFPRALARATAKVVSNPWQIATGADFIYRRTGGRRPLGTGLVNRYLARVIAASTVDEVVNLALTRVQHLLAPPQSLFAPGILSRVVRASRSIGRAPAPMVEAMSRSMVRFDSEGQIEDHRGHGFDEAS